MVKKRIWDAHGHLFTWATTPKRAYLDRKAYPLASAVPVLWEILSSPLLKEFIQLGKTLYNLAAKKDIDSFDIAKEYAETYQAAARAMAIQYRLSGVTDFNLLLIDFYGWNYRWDILKQWAIGKDIARICAKEGVKCHLVGGIDPHRPGATKLLSEHHKDLAGVKLYLPISEATQREVYDFAEVCHFFGLPIFSHCSPGGIGELEFKASPDYVWELLALHTSLKWCFCHGGGDRGSWRSTVERACLEFEGAHLDLSFRDKAIYDPDSFFKRLNGYAYMEATTVPAIAEKVLWGTDRPLHQIYYPLDTLVKQYKESTSWLLWQCISWWNTASFMEKKTKG